jgi:predicted Zn-ribbon and HTH transcriptional regulator
VILREITGLNKNIREMTVIKITRPARCKDCAYLKMDKIGKRIRHRCDNLLSPQFLELRTQIDPVCEKWAITKTEER